MGVCATRHRVEVAGHRAPSVGPEAPFELLVACHERVQRSLALLHKLQDYLAQKGWDEQAAEAAKDVLSYFEIAAPLHHQDEELHVFPMLADADDAKLVAAVAGLRADHARMEALWAGLRVTLLAWSRPDSAGDIDAVVRERAMAFDGLYAAHVLTEEGTVFPAARARMVSAELAAMSADMERRRRV